ncbi:MAG: hypothetical protein IJ389_05600 [Clostridia bacterium]|nr:hypothetical protein [Clostridia bacterium]
MKRNTKAILIAASALLALTMAVVGTVAFLISSQEVVNTFTVGQVHINLDEADVDEDGDPVEGADRVKGNEYHLVPGQTYTKDPTVTVLKGSEEAYVRMTVTLNKVAELKAILGDDFLPENYVAGWDRDVWNCVEITDNGDNTVTYEFRYYEIVDARDAADDVVLDALFDEFTLPGDFTNEDLKSIEGFKIVVQGHAIQATGFEDADAAWAAFNDQVK